MAQLEFFWDVASPYSYVAWKLLPKHPTLATAPLRLRPFLLGGVFKSTGNKMPASLPAKARYMREDLRRCRDVFGIPLRLPPDEVAFPINSLLPMRVAVAAEASGVGAAFCTAIYDAYWGQGRDVSTPEAIKSVLEQARLDLDLIDQASMPHVKDTLKSNTEEAVARGAFGAPTFFVGDQMFWGHDRFDFIAAALLPAPR